MICDMDCLNCSFSDCINDSDLLSTQERKSSNDLDKEILNSRLSSVYSNEWSKTL